MTWLTGWLTPRDALWFQMMNYEGQDWEGSLRIKEKPETLAVCCFDPVAVEGKTPYTLVTDPDLSPSPFVLVTDRVMYTLVTSCHFWSLSLTDTAILTLVTGADMALCTYYPGVVFLCNGRC